MQKQIRFKKPTIVNKFGAVKELQTDRFDLSFFQRCRFQPTGKPISFSDALRMKMKDYLSIKDGKEKTKFYKIDLIEYANEKGLTIVIQDDEYEIL